MNNSFNDNTEINNVENSYTMIKIIVLLIGLQISRIILKQGAYLFLPYNKLNDILISIVIIALITLFIIYKSKKNQINLHIFSYMKSQESRGYYYVVTISLILLMITSPCFEKNQSIENILSFVYMIIIIPLYEELLFRSYIWDVLQKDNIKEMKIYYLTTLLFAIYHIGYIDTIIMKSGFNHIATIIIIKFSLMLSCGLFIGFFRYKIKNSYSCMLVHSFINIIFR